MRKRHDCTVEHETLGWKVIHWMTAMRKENAVRKRIYQSSTLSTIAPAKRETIGLLNLLADTSSQYDGEVAGNIAK